MTAGKTTTKQELTNLPFGVCWQIMSTFAAIHCFPQAGGVSIPPPITSAEDTPGAAQQ